MMIDGPPASPSLANRTRWRCPHVRWMTSPESPPMTSGPLSVDPTRAKGIGVDGEHDGGTVSRRKALDEVGHATRQGWAELELRRAIPIHRGPNPKRG
jgi:hypothetical protein